MVDQPTQIPIRVGIQLEPASPQLCYGTLTLKRRPNLGDDLSHSPIGGAFSAVEELSERIGDRILCTTGQWLHPLRRHIANLEA